MSQSVLYMAATSLGPCEDLPAKSLDLLRTADLLIFEEDKAARRFLKAAEVHRHYLRFSEHQQSLTLDELKECLKQGGTALYMSDQGTPNLADPGYQLTKIAYEMGAQVRCVTGPSSVAALISVAPFACRQFFFQGFLPKREDERSKTLLDLKRLPYPFVILETPYRLVHVIESCSNILGKERKAVLGIDIGGEQENFIYTNFADLLVKVKGISQQGNKLNYTLICEGLDEGFASPKQGLHHKRRPPKPQPTRSYKHKDQKRRRS